MLRRLTITVIAAALINWVLIALLGADTHRTGETPDHGDAESSDLASESERVEPGPVIERARPSSTQRASAPPLAQPRYERADRAQQPMPAAPVALALPIASSTNEASETSVTGQIEDPADLASAWSREPKDAAGSRAVDAYVRQIAQAARLDPDLVKDADCGTSVCRVTLSFTRVEDALAFQQAQAPDLRYAIMKPDVPPAEAKSGLAPSEEPVARESGTPAMPIENAPPPPQTEGDDDAKRPMEIEILLARKDVHETTP